MKFDRKIHFTERQLCDLTGLSFDAIRVIEKTDPKFPELIFINNSQQKVYDKEQALEWISSIDEPEPLQIVPPRKGKPLENHGVYKPSHQMKINMERSAKLYPHKLITPKGVGNYHHNEDYPWTN